MRTAGNITFHVCGKNPPWGISYNFLFMSFHVNIAKFGYIILAAFINRIHFIL